MDAIGNSGQVLSAMLVFFGGLIVSLKVGHSFRSSYKRSLALYVWHSIFCVIYVLYVLEFGGDAVNYFRLIPAPYPDFSFGSPIVRTVTHFLSHYLGLSFFASFLVFNIFGVIGLLAFDATLQLATALKNRNTQLLATIIVFLPSVSFWSAAIGKDSVAFMATGLALWAAQEFQRRTRLMALAIFFMLLVRPHIAALMIMAVASSMVFQPRLSLSTRVIVGFLAFAVASVMVPLAINYAGLDSGSGMADFVEYVELRQGYNMKGGGGIDISSMSLPLKLFTYLFRPLPFEAHSIPALAASLDNVVLLGLVGIGLRQMIRNRKTNTAVNRSFLWIYSISSWVILATTTANLGISVRQKWMFVPMMIFLFVSVIGRQIDRRTSHRIERDQSFKVRQS